MASREIISYMLICPGCGRMGSTAWDEPTEEALRMIGRKLIDISGGFHLAIDKSGVPGKTIVCNSCDTVQPD